MRLITLIGPGGVGKTRLALEIARRIATEARHARGVRTAGRNSGAGVRRAGDRARRSDSADITAWTCRGALRVACADRPTLLVLDNFEQVLDAAPLVADLLSSVASLRLLATSRAPLRVRGEREYVVGPLALDVDPEAMSPADLAALSRGAAVLERVRDVQPEFRLTAANGPTVAAICRRLDALPLALELAAPWMKVLTAEDLLRRLGRTTCCPRPPPRAISPNGNRR